MTNLQVFATPATVRCAPGAMALFLPIKADRVMMLLAGIAHRVE